MADFGETQTDQYIDGLENTLNMLAQCPDIGCSFFHDKTKTEYHYYRYVSHIVYYRKRISDIFIIRILHTRMLPEKHL
jgi:toxin ParE1/3/4